MTGTDHQPFGMIINIKCVSTVSVMGQAKYAGAQVHEQVKAGFMWINVSGLDS